jgi:hypothetical protein
MVPTRQIVLGLASLSTALAAYAPYEVRNEGEPVGQIKNIGGSKFLNRIKRHLSRD